jgi:hypothetical protein
MGTQSTENWLLEREGPQSSRRSAQAAFVELARLLARQAAREWAESAQEAELPQTDSVGTEPQT